MPVVPQPGAAPGEVAPDPRIRRAPRFYRPELDSLRFLAFFMVFASHLVFWQPGRSMLDGWGSFGAALLASGGFGVDLFFVLSAYLITELLLREKAHTGALDVRGFYLRRILRIWPLYFAVVGLAYVSQFFWPAYSFPPAALASFLLLAGNWYSTGGMVVSFAAPLWSVSIEEQFYLLWPQWVRRATLRGVTIAALCLIVIAFATRWFLLSRGATQTMMWANTFGRLDPIAVGILIAAWMQGRPLHVPAWLRPVLIGGGFAVTAYAFTACRIGESAIPVHLGMIGHPLATVGVTAIFFGFYGWKGIALRPLLYLGQISYGLYVFHRLALDVTYQIPLWVVLPFGWILKSDVAVTAVRFAISLAMTVAISAASYRWLEGPFLRLKGRFTHVRKEA